MVAEVVERIRSGEVFSLVVTPDGTRSGHTHWKSSFYRIARETGMPVTLGNVDRTTMTTGLGPTFELTGDVAHDMGKIRAFYADQAGCGPSTGSRGARANNSLATQLPSRRMPVGDSTPNRSVVRSSTRAFEMGLHGGDLATLSAYPGQ